MRRSKSEVLPLSRSDEVPDQVRSEASGDSNSRRSARSESFSTDGPGKARVSTSSSDSSSDLGLEQSSGEAMDSPSRALEKAHTMLQDAQAFFNETEALLQGDPERRTRGPTLDDRQLTALCVGRLLLTRQTAAEISAICEKLQVRQMRGKRSVEADVRPLLQETQAFTLRVDTLRSSHPLLASFCVPITREGGTIKSFGASVQ
jgi:hypothetical protein